MLVRGPAFGNRLFWVGPLPQTAESAPPVHIRSRAGTLHVQAHSSHSAAADVVDWTAFPISFWFLSRGIIAGWVLIHHDWIFGVFRIFQGAESLRANYGRRFVDTAVAQVRGCQFLLPAGDRGPFDCYFDSLSPPCGHCRVSSCWSLGALR